MRRLWRLLRFTVSILSRTGWLWLSVRFVPEARRPLYRARVQQRACRVFCCILGVRVTVRGTLPRHHAVLAVSNHLGLLDPWILASQMPLAFVAKAEMARWPVVGWICRTVGIIFVERERRMATKAFVEQVQSRLREGVRVLVFPEGTTTRGDAVLLPFKTGGFEAVAGMEEAVVLPLYLHVDAVDGRPAAGALRRRVAWSDPAEPMLRHAWSLLGVREVHVELRVGVPIPTAGQDRKALARQAYAAVRALAGDAHPAPPVASPSEGAGSRAGVRRPA
ncbi:1-acyl-sn-glycerol-3-phosphate acyltransferase [Rhodocaloribacter litoris]|uniref:lysophospholipid acyltransferase family protein n=1 Tax=Rhodocaloribacter litoris TaxID=2558931 RepID=UPI0014209590|nr:lysophospholipid acyltransferase family protein [Rhodocaloribacter litoris]QXD15863.1 1-acyl-sn-glycerol-3-phosphate acyltransferase [Rhodocaloribacter litoris]